MKAFYKHYVYQRVALSLFSSSPIKFPCHIARIQYVFNEQ
jgi:hypothetical protein